MMVLVVMFYRAPVLVALCLGGLFVAPVAAQVVALPPTLAPRATGLNPAFDYAVTFAGGHVVVQGGALIENVSRLVTAGAPLAGDNGVEIDIQGMPAGMTYSFPDIDAGQCCGISPNYWLYGFGPTAGCQSSRRAGTSVRG